MDLSEIMWDILKDQAIKAISKKTWVDSSSTKDMAAKALPLILWALKNNSKDDSKKLGLDKAVEKNDGSILWNLDNLDLEDGAKILWHVFGDKKEKAEKEVWDKNILAALAPIVMWALWKANSTSWKTAKDLLSSDSLLWWIMTSILDKDKDWDIKDDLIWMAMNFISWKK